MFWCDYKRLKVSLVITINSLMIQRTKVKVPIFHSFKNIPSTAHECFINQKVSLGGRYQIYLTSFYTNHVKNLSILPVYKS